MTDLTPKQKLILDYIKSEIKTNGIPPTIREICAAANLSSTSSVHLHLSTLEKKGYITRSKSKNRSILINDADFYGGGGYGEEDYVKVPIIGNVSAGVPINAEENVEGYFPVPNQFVKNNTFMLRIRGNSMMNAGIFNNDLVLVKQQSTACNNDIIIALLDDSATCKRFFRQDDGYIRLQPENPDYEPIIIKDVKVLGKVTGLFRNM